MNTVISNNILVAAMGSIFLGLASSNLVYASPLNLDYIENT